MWLQTTRTRLGRGFFGIAGKRVGFARKWVRFWNAMKWAGERPVGRVRGSDRGQGLVNRKLPDFKPRKIYDFALWLSKLVIGIVGINV